MNYTFPSAGTVETRKGTRMLVYTLWGLRSLRGSPRSYLCEIEDMRVRDREQSIHCASEGIDLLVGVPHKDLPTRLGQNYVHDSCNQEEET